MSGRGNSFRKNTQNKNQARSPRGQARHVRSQASRFEWGEWVGKVVKILGLFLLILSIYFLIAFTSYLFTWQEDHSYVSASNGGWNTLFKSRAELEILGVTQPTVQNWMGKFGALLAHQFIYKWFGVASFIFVGILFVVGYRMLFKVKLASIWKTLAYSLFFLVYVSLGIAFIHSFFTTYPHFLEGEFGFWTNRLLMAQIGAPGVAGLLIFLLLAVLILLYNFDFKLPKRKKKDSGEVSEVSAEREENPVEQENKRNEHFLADAEYQLDPVEFSMEGDQEPEAIPISPALEVAKDENIQNPTKPEVTIEPIQEEEPVAKAESPALTVEAVNEEKPSTADKLVEEFGQYDPKLDLSGYQYPGLDLLTDYGSGKITINNQELEANKDKIVETLGNYNIEIAKIKATIGPTVTLYEIIPKPGVRISRIKNLEDDIALSLAALGIRIIAPMPGKGTIGIEVPNSHPEMVSMRSVLATEKFQHTKMDLPIALGKTISNEVFIADLAKMPHLLVAGATGQGKSVGINAILTSLLYKKHPAELKFVLVDPKKVELSLFKKIERHFLAKLPDEEEAIITDTKKVINTLVSLCKEMDLRYDLR